MELQGNGIRRTNAAFVRLEDTEIVGLPARGSEATHLAEIGHEGQFPSLLYLSKWTLIWPMRFGS